MLVAPAIAGVAVGVGVPILLAYIYGVVPVSLCQNGVCGVSASPLGVRIDFDDDDDVVGVVGIGGGASGVGSAGGIGVGSGSGGLCGGSGDDLSAMDGNTNDHGSVGGPTAYYSRGGAGGIGAGTSKHCTDAVSLDANNLALVGNPSIGNSPIPQFQWGNILPASTVFPYCTDRSISYWKTSCEQPFNVAIFDECCRVISNNANALFCCCCCISFALFSMLLNRFWIFVLFRVIGEASVALSASGSASLGSASQLFVRDRDRESDREDCESASQLGLAGSIVSNASAARRLEVQAELVGMVVCSPNKRSSFASSETASATISLSERSNTLSMADDGAASVASTRALAGSLLSYKVFLILLCPFRFTWLPYVSQWRITGAIFVRREWDVQWKQQ